MKITTILKSLAKFLFKNIVNILSLGIALYLFLRPVSGIPEVVFLDVGQGDSILIQQGNFQMLVDGGPDISVLFEISKYMDPRDGKVEVMVLTHPHADHVNGLLYVLDRYEVDEIWINVVEYENREYQYLLSEYSDKVREVSLGDVLAYGNIEIGVLYPFGKPQALEEQGGNINNESVVLNVGILNRQGNVVRTLLMGDAEKELEMELLKKGLVEDVDILKAGHHCSRTASSECFLSVSRPEVGVCSFIGGNKFGHPHDETLNIFKAYNVQYMATEKEGSIRFLF